MKRKTPLRAKRPWPQNTVGLIRDTSLDRARPMKVAGKATKRRQSFYDEQRAIVMERAKGRCESCGMAAERLDCNHVFGRANKLPVRWSYLAALMEAVCWKCHQGFHERIDLRELSRQSALGRLIEVLDDHYDLLEELRAGRWSALDALRTILVREEAKENIA